MFLVGGLREEPAIHQEVNVPGSSSTSSRILRAGNNCLNRGHHLQMCWPFSTLCHQAEFQIPQPWEILSLHEKILAKAERKTEIKIHCCKLKGQE